VDHHVRSCVSAQRASFDFVQHETRKIEMMKACNDEGTKGVEKSRTITTSNCLTGVSTLSEQ
jgi:hypothetical protein